MKAADYNDIGRFLADSRESLGLSVEDAGRAMNIRPHYIRAIESGKLTELPGKAYIRGYIRNYAAFLRLDGTEILEAYDMLPSIQARPQQEVPVPTRTEQLPPQFLLWASLMGLLLLFVVWKLLFSAPPRIEHAVPDVPETLLQRSEDLSAMQDDWAACLRNPHPFCLADMRFESEMGASQALYSPLRAALPPMMPQAAPLPAPGTEPQGAGESEE